MAGRVSRLSIGRVSPVMRMRISTGLPITANPVGIKAESVGGQSVTYEDAAASSERYEAELLEAADLWIPRSDPLRYAGVYGC